MHPSFRFAPAAATSLVALTALASAAPAQSPGAAAHPSSPRARTSRLEQRALQLARGELAAHPRTPSSAASSSTAVTTTSSSASTSLGAAVAQTWCVPALRDAANAQGCIQASSVPELGSLYPLGPDFNVAPNGNVGIGTLNPAHALDIAGDMRASGRAALGNNAVIGQGGYFYDSVLDLSSRLTNMSSALDWTPVRSYIELEPSVGEYVSSTYCHDLWGWVTPQSTQDMGHVQGSYIAAFNDGTGNLASLTGGSLIAQTSASHVDYQLGGYAASFASGTGTITENRWLLLQGGHWGGGSGAIGDDYGLYLSKPDATGPVQNHYGIFLEPQVGASGANYALYSQGGDVYLNGKVGIGAQPSTYALQVGNPGDGSEARANAWNVLSSREYKRDIEALDGAAYERILAQIEATDVVHYRYADDDHVHLGVIAEDSPKEILSRDGKGVSLGDYAAFLLAGMKAQQRELDALRGELEALRAQIGANAGAK